MSCPKFTICGPPPKRQAPAHAGTPYTCGVSLPLSRPRPLASLCPSEAHFVLKALAHRTVPHMALHGGWGGDNRLLVHSRAALRQAGLMLLEAGAMTSLSHLPGPVSPPRAGSHSSVRAGIFMSFQQTHLTEKDALLIHSRST